MDTRSDGARSRSAPIPSSSSPGLVKLDSPLSLVERSDGNRESRCFRSIALAISGTR